VLTRYSTSEDEKEWTREMVGKGGGMRGQKMGGGGGLGSIELD
jgi:hypothetical protein